MSNSLRPRPLAFRVLALLLALSAPAANAVDTGFNFRWGYDFGYGSKKLVEAARVGFPNDRRSITASEGEFITLGISLIDDSHEFALDASVGVKSATLCDYYNFNNSGGDYWWIDVLWPTCAWDATLNAEFSRVPLDVMALYKGLPYVRLGAGVTYQLAPELSVSAPLANYKILFDNALGYVVEIGIGDDSNSRSDGSPYLGLRYAWLTYRIDGIEMARANGFGLFIGFAAR